MRHIRLQCDLLALLLIPAAVAFGQTPALSVTPVDYARAERRLAATTTPLVLHSGVRPTWLPDGRFWYRTIGERGPETWLVDPATATRVPCELDACRGANDTTPRTRPGEVLSPDRTRALSIRNWNLWLRDLTTGRETALTTDGVENFGYATDNAGWRRSDRPIVVWSPDSTKIATFQQDQRGVGDMYLVDTKIGHPTLQAWKYPLPGDAAIPMLHRVVIDLPTSTMTRFRTEPDPHRSSLYDDIICDGTWAGAICQDWWGDVQWSADGRTIAFVSTSRDHKRTALRMANVATGDVRTVFEETVDTFFESGTSRISWKYLSASNEVIWFSERSNWGQLYLYDAATGRAKNTITRGAGAVTELVSVDETRRELLFVAVGKEPGRDPYFRHLYKAGLDGSSQRLLTPADADHAVAAAPSGRFFVDVYSTPALPPVAELRDFNGRLVLPLETADISRLVATGWQPPRPITVKARDGVTDLYGLLYTPSTLDLARRYPIVNHIYPGPQTGSVGTRTFRPSRGDAQALAELGFIVVEIDGMGTPWRGKAFHDASYGNLGDNTLADQVAGMRELAARYPWIDLSRAGIYGHSGGGYAAAGAMLRHPDVFSVGIAEAGNHDNRVYEDDWGEKWQGLLTRNADGTTNYDNQANPPLARNLKGKLLLAHGSLDDNVPPSGTLALVDELIKANKDFDLLILPNQGHDFGNLPYMVRRRWDYFVTHLLGATPPREYQIKAVTPPQ